MEREQRGNVTVDVCNPCDGVWFDIGEIALAYDLEPVQGLASAFISRHHARQEADEAPAAPADEKPQFDLADILPAVATILLRLFLRI
jgi:Zn-finger nucleic acid-binding protein